MNLYTINFAHYAPKDEESGIKEYIVAENDEEVYEYIKKKYDSMWAEHERAVINENADEDGYDFVEIDDDGEVFEYDYYINWYDEDGNPELFKDRMMRLNGEYYDDGKELTDLYYGATLYGWELVSENISETDHCTLINLGIIEDEKAK